MFSIKITSNFDANKLADQIIDSAKKNLKAKIEAVRCPVHNKTGKAVIEQDARGNVNYQVHGCCHALADAVKKALGARN